MNLNSMMESLANLEWWKVLIIVAVLLGIRFALIKQENKAAKSVAETAESLAVAMALVFFLIRPFIVQAFFIPSASMHPGLLENDHILVNKFVYRVKQPARGDVVVFKSPPEASPDGVERDFIKRVVGVPGDVVQITQGYVIIGNEQYNHADLRSLLGTPGRATRIKLLDNRIFVDNKEVTKAEVAAAAGEPKAKVKIVPGKVFIDGKPLDEPYTAEDPDSIYPGLPNELVNSKWIVVNKKGEQMVKIPQGRLLVMGDNRNDSNDSRFWGLLDRKKVLGKAMFIFWPLNRVRLVR
ncbi:MAG: signal peptidase I [Armatimonadota bacterium]|jgi:signal peptidase I